MPDADLPAHRERRRLESKAKNFRPNAQMEAAIRLRDSQRPHDNAKFDALPSSMKLALGFYLESKKAATELESASE